MTSGRVPDGPSRGADAPTRASGTRDGIGAIIVVLALGLVFRLIMVQVNPGSGFRVDLASFQFWANDLAANALSGFYQRPFFHDYTPGYLYVLYLVGLVGRGGDIGDLIKIPPILADVALGYLVWSMAREVGARRVPALLGAALVVFNPVSWFDSVLWGQVDSFGVVFLLLGLRALWHDKPERAAIWTVIAALIKPQLAILVPLVAVVTIRRALWPPTPVDEPADGAIETAASTALEPRTAGADPAAREPAAREPAAHPGPGLLARLRAWERRTNRPIRIATTALAGLLTAIVLCFPFGLSVLEGGGDGLPLKSGLLYEMFNTASEYPYASVNAYNPWALASLAGNGVAANGGWACDAVILHPQPGSALCTDAVMIGPIPAVVVGAALLVAAFVLVSIAVARRPTPLTMLTGLAILAIAFFILPTRVHERYLFPFVALGAILAAISWRWLIAYVVLSATTFLNMYVVLTTLYPDNPGISDWLGIGSAVRGQTGVTIVALTAAAAALWAFTQLRPAAQRALVREAAGGGILAGVGVVPVADDSWESDEGWDADEEWDREAADRDEGGPQRVRPGAIGEDGSARRPGIVGGSAAALGWSAVAGPGIGGGGGGAAPAGAAGALAIGGAHPVAPMPRWSAPPGLFEVGPIEWFRAGLRARPIRADRSRALEHEPPGRLDKLDLWILVVLVVSVLGIRMFRLSEPYQMHFDEVYHARTATEFLQDWRYGLSHDIYEWTHPHLAKYAMAGGLVAWGDDRVTATSDLGVPVLDAAVEPRLDDPAVSGQQGGDRLDVATGSEVRSYDLVTRGLVATIPVPGASALAVDAGALRLFVAASDGAISTIDLAALDQHQAGAAGATVPEADAFGTVDGSIRRLLVAPDGGAVIAETTDDRVITLDADTAEIRGTVQLSATGDLSPAGTSPAVVGAPGAVADKAAAARALASIFGGDAATYAQRLAGTADRLVVAGITSTDQRTRTQTAIDGGALAGLSIDTVPEVAVADAKGVEFIDPSTGELTTTVDVGAPAHGLALATVGDPTLYVATDRAADQPTAGRLVLVAVGGDSAKDGPRLVQGPSLTNGSMPMPGAVSRVLYDDATEMIHVLGMRPDGITPTVYVVETHANAVFADAALPFQPSAWVMDSARDAPTADRQQILAFSPDGAAASVDVGMHEFAWRLPGVLAGAGMAGALYLLARILFRRRSVGVLVAVISLVDGMFFVQSRIGMNDAYVGFFIVAAYAVFAALWLGVWKHRGAFWIGIPIVGALLGLGLASKWVALYAIGGVALLIMIRSALGRLLAILGMIALTAGLGYLAINVPAGFGNLPFVAIMVALTIVAVVANVTHPVAWTLDETRFAVGAPIVLGGIAMLALVATGHATPAATVSVKGVSSLVTTPMAAAIGLFLLGPIAWFAFAVAGRFGFGPLAPLPAPDEPAALLPPPAPPTSIAWLRPGAQYGLPVVWMVLSLLVLPLAIYIASYIPWAFVENHVLFPGWPPGHTGQNLFDLTGAMYAYHNGLTAPHAASSPWWAWLFDFKPVWFYQEGLAGNTTSAIYDAGNLVAWWLGLPALAFAAWQAYSRRSLALALVTIGFACQWVSWARIDRASFQYHYYTSLPFLFLALAYFLAELWHGASRRTWLMARLTAAAAVLGPALFWVFDRPLCGFVGVDRANTSAAQACQPTIPSFVLTANTLVLAIVLGGAFLLVLRELTRIGGDDDLAADGSGGRGGASVFVPLIAISIVASVLLVAIRLFVPDTPLLAWSDVPVEPIAVILGLLIAVPFAALVATARDARRFVIGAVVAMIAWFVIEYPNISALPLPTAIANVYQGVLPTYLYAFQFPVNNTAANVPIHLWPVPVLLLVSLCFLALVVAYSAWVWRLALAERRAADGDRLELGGAAGGTGGAGSG